MAQTIIVEFHWNNQSKDIEIPLDISCDELIYALNEGIGLAIDVDNKQSFQFVADNPKTLIVGEKSVEEIGLRDGAIITFVEK